MTSESITKFSMYCTLTCYFPFPLFITYTCTNNAHYVVLTDFLHPKLLSLIISMICVAILLVGQPAQVKVTRDIRSRVQYLTACRAAPAAQKCSS